MALPLRLGRHWPCQPGRACKGAPRNGCDLYICQSRKPRRVSGPGVSPLGQAEGGAQDGARQRKLTTKHRRAGRARGFPGAPAPSRGDQLQSQSAYAVSRPLGPLLRASTMTLPLCHRSDSVCPYTSSSAPREDLCNRPERKVRAAPEWGDGSGRLRK